METEMRGLNSKNGEQEVQESSDNVELDSEGRSEDQTVIKKTFEHNDQNVTIQARAVNVSCAHHHAIVSFMNIRDAIISKPLSNQGVSASYLSMPSSHKHDHDHDHGHGHGHSHGHTTSHQRDLSNINKSSINFVEQNPINIVKQTGSDESEPPSRLVTDPELKEEEDDN